MRPFRFFAILLSVMILVVGCSTERTTAPPPEPFPDQSSLIRDQATAEILAMTGWPLDKNEVPPQADPDKSFNLIVDYDCQEVAPGIMHYRWEVRVGWAAEDVIALHRVVKEGRRGRPIRTKKTMFLQHGDAKDFAGMFLPGTLSETTPDDFGAAVHWAREDVDVWGIDQAWTLVPAETVDLSFMADWGLDKQYQDLDTGVAIARLLRLFTGNGFGKMNLLGYSSGSGTGYALVNAETQRPPGLRQIGGWIPVDYSPISDNEEWNESQNCLAIAEYQGLIDNGEFGYFVGFDFLGVLARDNPDGGSPAFPGFTNLQAAMFVGAGQIFIGDIHYLAGIWENGLPVDFIHTTVPRWLDFMVAGMPWEPVQFMLDYSTWSCRDTDVAWDDHYSDITLPVLNVAAAGGLGPTTHYNLSLLGSDDITDLNLQLRPDDEVLFDFGHIDLWIADSAPELVWDPILEWVEEHTPNRGHRGHRRDRD